MRVPVEKLRSGQLDRTQLNLEGVVLLRLGKNSHPVVNPRRTWRDRLRKSIPLVSVFLRKIAAVLPDSGRGKPGWRSLPMGPLTADNLRQPLVVSSRVCEAPALQWPWGVSLCGTKNPGRWGATPWIAEATEVAWGHSGRWAF